MLLRGGCHRSVQCAPIACKNNKNNSTVYKHSLNALKKHGARPSILHQQHRAARPSAAAAAAAEDARPLQQDERSPDTDSKSSNSKGAIVAAVPTPEGTAWAGAYMSRARSVPAAVAEAVAAINAAAAALPTPAAASAGAGQAAGVGSSSSSSSSSSNPTTAAAPCLLGPPDLALVFAAAAYGDQLEEVVPALRRAVPSLRNVFGCTSFGVIGSANGAPTDAEGVPALSVTLARLPGADVRVTHTLRSGIPDEDAPPDAWASLVGLPLALQQQPAPSRAPSPGSSSSSSPNASDGSSSSSSSPAGGSDDTAAAATTTAQAGAQQPPQPQPQPQESFLVLADPRFQQARALLAGLDFAFPAAAKVGGVVSSGQRHKRRAMFAWSRDAPVDPGERRRRQQQQQQQQQSGSPRQRRQGRSRLSALRGQRPRRSAREEAQQRRQQAVDEDAAEFSSGSREQHGSGNFLGDLFGKLASRFGSALAGSGRNDDAGDDGGDRGKGAHGGSDGASHPEDADGGGADSGLRLYGAAVLALRGAVALEPAATSQGYRPAGDRTWVVGRTSRDGAVIYSLRAAPDGGGGGGGNPSSSSSTSGGAPAAGGGDSDSDDDDDDELPPLLAIVDALERAGLGRGEEGELTESEIEELSNDRVFVAIAPDALSADSDIGPDDFQMMKMTDFDESLGAVCVDGRVRAGYRLKLVVRDPEGTRADLDAKLVAAKRAELTAAVAGAPRAPPLAALVFADLERGAALHGEAGYEAGRVGALVPTAPVCGMFSAAEVSTVNRRAGLYELATVAAVLRPVTAPASAAVDDGNGGAAVKKV